MRNRTVLGARPGTCRRQEPASGDCPTCPARKTRQRPSGEAIPPGLAGQPRYGRGRVYFPKANNSRTPNHGLTHDKCPHCLTDYVVLTMRILPKGFVFVTFCTLGLACPRGDSGGRVARIVHRSDVYEKSRFACFDQLVCARPCENGTTRPLRSGFGPRIIRLCLSPVFGYVQWARPDVR